MKFGNQSKIMNGLYEVSNFGNVRRIRFINGKHNFQKIKKCKQTLNTWGYMTVNLSKNGKSNTKRVHKLVANAFLGESILQIDHIDGNKQNNRLNNLEYVTAKENTQRAWRNGLAKNTKYQREIAKQVMTERWKNNNHRKVRGTKRTIEEKKELLTEEEKEYLKQVLKFGNYITEIRNGINYITKIGYFLRLNISPHHCNEIYIDKELYFKGLIEDKGYTLEELGVII